MNTEIMNKNRALVEEIGRMLVESHDDFILSYILHWLNVNYFILNSGTYNKDF